MACDHLSISHTLSISYNYLLAIIYKLAIICKGCYATIIAFTNKDPQLPLHSISTRFYLILFITYSLITHVLT